MYEQQCWARSGTLHIDARPISLITPLQQHEALGLSAYAVEHRTHEIGVRIALGASPQRVRTMVVFEGMRLAAIGVVLGVGGALALTPLMTSLLYGARASNPVVLTLVVILLTSVALFAVHIPARRVTRVDPVLTLRWE